jgi:Rab11 family-interacting protein 1/2/5
MVLQSQVNTQKQKLSDMEDYIDNLLVRVMENKPTLLQSPYVSFCHTKYLSLLTL